MRHDLLLQLITSAKIVFHAKQNSKRSAKLDRIDGLYRLTAKQFDSNHCELVLAINLLEADVDVVVIFRHLTSTVLLRVSLSLDERKYSACFGPFPRQSSQTSPMSIKIIQLGVSSTNPNLETQMPI